MKVKRFFLQALAALALTVPGLAGAQQVATLSDYEAARNNAGSYNYNLLDTAVRSTDATSEVTFTATNFHADYDQTHYSSPSVTVYPTGYMTIGTGASQAVVRPLFNSDFVANGVAWCRAAVYPDSSLVVEWRLQKGSDQMNFRATIDTMGTVTFLYAPMTLAASSTYPVQVGMEYGSNSYYYLTAWNNISQLSPAATTLTLSPSQVPTIGAASVAYSFYRYCYHDMWDTVCKAENNYQWMIDYQATDATTNYYYLQGTANGSVSQSYTGPIFNTVDIYQRNPDSTLSYLILSNGTPVYTERCQHWGVLHLHIGDTTYGSVVDESCDTYQWTVLALDGTTATTRNYAFASTDVENVKTIRDTVVIQNADGCDSVVYLTLTLKRSSSSDSADFACDTYTFDYADFGGANPQHKTYTAPYNAVDRLVMKNQNGCDSTISLSLVVNSSNSRNEAITVCDVYDTVGDLMDAQGMGIVQYHYTTTGQYAMRFTNVDNCDSIVNLDLTVNYTTRATIDSTVCDAVDFEFNNFDGTNHATMPYTTTGTYSEVVTNADACDSIITLNLTVNHSTEAPVKCVTANKPYEYTWIFGDHDSTFTNESTLYYDTITNMAGCDSVATLDLTFTAPLLDTICGGGFYKGTFVQFDHDTILYDEPSTYVLSNGCENIVLQGHAFLRRQFHIERVWANEDLTWNGITYTQTTTGIAPSWNSTAVNTCDSTWFLYYNREDTLQLCMAQLPYEFHGIEITNADVHNQLTTKEDTIKYLHDALGNRIISQYSVDGATTMDDVDSMWVYKVNFIINDYTTTPTDYALDSVFVYDPTSVANSTHQFVIGNVTRTIEMTACSDTVHDTFLTHFTSTLTGCDSVVNVMLTAIPKADTVYVYDSVYYCGLAGQTDVEYVVHSADDLVKDTITSADLTPWPDNDTNYYVRDTVVRIVPTVQGCDSAVAVIFIGRGVPYHADDTINNDGSIVFDGVLYQIPTAMEYLDTTLYYSTHGQSVEGCDSVYSLRLLVGRRNIISHNIDTCQQYRWTVTCYDTAGNTYDVTRTFIYRDRTGHLNENPWYWEVVDTGLVAITPATGHPEIHHLQHNLIFDSVDQLVLTMSEGYSEFDTVTLSMAEVYYANNKQYSVIYSDTAIRLDATGFDVRTDTTDFLAKRNQHANHEFDIDWHYGPLYQGRYCDSVKNIHYVYTYDSVVTNDAVTVYLSDLYTNNYVLNYGYRSYDLSSLVGTDSAQRVIEDTLYYGMDSTNVTWQLSAVDSISHVILTVINNFDTLAEQVICVNEALFTLPHTEGLPADSVIIRSGAPATDAVAATDGFQVATVPANLNMGATYSFDYIVRNNVPTQYHLDLIQLRTLTGTEVVDACDAFTWINGRTYTASTTTPTFLLEGGSVNGCDSLVTLNLNINFTKRDTLPTVEACETYTYVWDAETTRTYTETTFDSVVYMGPAGCDSVKYKQFVINHVVENVQVAHNTNTTPGTWTYTWVQGTAPAQNIRNYAMAEKGQDTTFRDTIVIMPTIAGQCKQLDILELHFVQPVYDTVDAYACDAAYAYTAANHSVINFNWNASNSTFTQQGTANAVADGNVVYNDITARDTDEAGYVYITNVNSIRLNKSHKSYNVNMPTVFSCYEYTWQVEDNGNTINVGTFTQSYQAPYGPSYKFYNEGTHCDSLVYLNLSIIDSAIVKDTLVYCVDDWNANTHTYQYDGTDYPVVEGMNYFVTNNTPYGCDSIAHVQVIVPTYEWVTDLDSAICVNTPINYNRNGHTWSITNAVAGVYSDTAFRSYVTINGTSCPTVRSVAKLNVLPVTSGDTIVTLCTALQNDFTWYVTENYSSLAARQSNPVVDDHRGRFNPERAIYPYGQDVEAQAIINNVYGCDSAINLHLTYGHSNEHSMGTQQLCISELPYTFSNTNSGNTYIINRDSVIRDTVNQEHSTTCYEVYVYTFHVNDVESDPIAQAEVCDSYTWAFNGETYTESGVIIDTLYYDFAMLTNGERCARRIDTLILTVNHRGEKTFNEVACDSYTWAEGNGQTYTNSISGVTTTINTIAGCDSVLTLNLTINHTQYHLDEVANACDYYDWEHDGITDRLTRGGLYKDTLIAAANNGCDSIVNLSLVVNRSDYPEVNVTDCDSYTWAANGTTYTTSGDYTAQFTNGYGCDSIITLHLTLNESTTGEEAVSACDSYVWNGQSYDATGNYQHTFVADNGCDSTATLHLTIGRSTTSIDTVFSCDEYEWHGITYTQSTNLPVWRDLNAEGCPNTVTLNLTLGHSNHGYTNAAICQGATYTWNGNTYQSTAADEVVLPGANVDGCDSTDHLTLFMHERLAKTVDKVVCGNAYTWSVSEGGNGETYTTSGRVASVTLRSDAGCDSVVTLNLTLVPSVTDTHTYVVCDRYTWQGNEYTQNNEFIEHFSSVATGCDSIDVTYYVVNHSVDHIVEQIACDSYTWDNGITYGASTTQPTMRIANGADNGCDSIVHLHLTINRSIAVARPQTACDYYDWNGTRYTESGIYFDTIARRNGTGCDSAITMVLTINHSDTVVSEDTVCDVLRNWYGTDYTQSGTYYYTIANGNADHCNRVNELRLLVNHSTTGVDNQTACDSYTWIDGVNYTASNNNATYTVRNGNGCDSVVTLNLTINNRTTGVDRQTACDSYTWIDGVTYTASNNVATYTLDNAATNGCDSVVTLNLTINNSTTGVDEQTACDRYTWIDGVTYTASNNTATYTVRNGVGCDSVVTLNLTINNSTTGVDRQTACDQFIWIDGSTYLASCNTVTYTLRNSNAAGCDSVVTLNLTINRSTTGGDTVTACDGYTWIDGVTYTASNNTATHTVRNLAGCDSVVTLNLTINNTANGVDRQVSCDSYTWAGTVYTQSGTYTHTYPAAAANGCDSVATLILIVNRGGSNEATAVACDSYTWDVSGLTYDQSGDYTVTVSNPTNNCTSTETLHLTINRSTTGVDVQTACDNYTWIDGVTYTASNNAATYTLHNGVACDSVVTLNLTINNSTTGVDRQTACDNYTWIDGVTYTASNNTATYTLRNGDGCDSVVTLNLTINNSTTGVDRQTACDSYTWIDGVTYTASNNAATYTLRNGDGCDSVVTLNLTINNSTTGVDRQTACDNYTWIDGVTYAASNNNATYTVRNVAGCDSVVTLNLTINNSTTGVDRQTACDNYTWIDGVNYTVSNNTATYTLRNGVACDSVVTLNLTINNSTTGVDRQTVCDSYTWIDGVNYTVSNNTATYTLTNLAGCDSVVTLNLTVRHSTTGSENVTDCDSYTWAGTAYTQSGTYTHTYTALNGCDSVATLYLTINHNTTGVDVLTACDNYTWIDGVTYAASNNTATHTLRNAAGCDSVVTLNLTINNSTTGVDRQTACDSYTWIDGVNYTTSNNNATYTVSNRIGCDSVVTLNLTINRSTTGVDVQTACDNYTWIDGVTYTASNRTATYTLTNGAGCDSVVTLYLTINHSTSGVDNVTACNSYTWIDGVTYTASNNNATYTVRNGAGCDSLVTLNLTLGHSNNTETVANACDNYTWAENNTTYDASGVYLVTTLNAEHCYDTAMLTLTIRRSYVNNYNVTSCDSYTWIDGDAQTYTTSGTYRDTVTALNGCDSVLILNLTINQGGNNEVTAVACDSYIWDVNGQTYRQSGDYTATVANPTNNCSGTATLHLTINNSVRDTLNEVRCDSYTWNNGTGRTYTTSGVYTHEDVMPNTGCVHLTTLNLTINSSYRTTVDTTVCDLLTWRGNNYTVSGVSTATLRSTDGCDSVVTMNITVNRSTTGFDTVIACDNYTWIDGVTYTASNRTATHTLTSGAANGCDSLVTLNLTLNRSTQRTITANPCDSYTFVANGVVYTQTPAAPVIVTLTNGAGCDSVVTLNLTVRHSTTGSENVTDCDSYTWAGTAYTQSGTYTHTYTALNGCDSVATLYLTINENDTTESSFTACGNYNWYGQTLTTSGDYTHQSYTQHGCTLTEILHLTINQPETTAVAPVVACGSYIWNGQTYTTSGTYTHNVPNATTTCVDVETLTLTINQPETTAVAPVVACDSYIWNGQTYTTSGIYTHDVPNATTGCTDVETLTLTINQPETTAVAPVVACESYVWNGQTYTTSGTYTHNVPNATTGCTDVETLTLTINQPETTAVAPVVACDSYVWNGQTYTTSGTYSRNVPNATTGCTDVETLTLTINQPQTTTVTAVACDSYAWNGQSYTTSGTYSRNVANATTGCTDIEMLTLTINPSTTGVETLTACDSYTWHGQLYAASNNTATYTTTNMYGCDSVVTLHLTINPSTTGVETLTACNSYTWHGTTYTASNYTATYTTTNMYGCDSVATLHLTINLSNNTDAYADECDSYVWTAGNGQTYTTAGDYDYVTTNAAGCQDTATLHLTIRHSQTHTISAVACDNYVWDGDTYRTSGSYTNHYTALTTGCDSTVTLNLTVNYADTNRIDTTVCDSYTWNNVTYTVSGVYTDHFHTVYACDSTVIINLTVNYSTTHEFNDYGGNGDYVWNGTHYTTSGDYVQTLTADNGCDSVVTLHLTIINNAPLPQIVAYNSRVLMVNHYPYGKDREYVEYDSYQWYKDGEPISGADVDFFNEANFADLNGCYYVMVTKDNSGWVKSNTLCFGNADIDDVVETVEVTFTVAPNPVANGQTMRVETNLDETQLQGAKLVMYDLRGRIVMEQSMEQPTVMVPVHQSTGSYMLRLITRSGESYVKKVIIK